MNDHYKDATDGLRALRAQADEGHKPSEAAALAVIQTRATLAVAEEQAKTNQHLELANLIAYAQLRRGRRRPSMATEELVDRRMSAFQEISEELAEDEADL